MGSGIRERETGRDPDSVGMKTQGKENRGLVLSTL